MAESRTVQLSWSSPACLLLYKIREIGITGVFWLVSSRMRELLKPTWNKINDLS
jgi:hypothetical protein